MGTVAFRRADDRDSFLRDVIKELITLRMKDIEEVVLGGSREPGIPLLSSGIGRLILRVSFWIRMEGSLELLPVPDTCFNEFLANGILSLESYFK